MSAPPAYDYWNTGRTQNFPPSVQAHFWYNQSKETIWWAPWNKKYNKYCEKYHKYRVEIAAEIPLPGRHTALNNLKEMWRFTAHNTHGCLRTSRSQKAWAVVLGICGRQNEARFSGRTQPIVDLCHYLTNLKPARSRLPRRASSR